MELTAWKPDDPPVCVSEVILHVSWTVVTPAQPPPCGRRKLTEKQLPTIVPGVV